MEEEGIFYFFKHEDGKHTLVMANQKGAYADCKESEVDYPARRGQPRRQGPYHPLGTPLRVPNREMVADRLQLRGPSRPRRVTPADLLMTNQTTTVKLDDIKKYEFYDYPGDYEKKDEGDKLHQNPHGGG